MWSVGPPASAADPPTGPVPQSFVHSRSVANTDPDALRAAQADGHRDDF